VPDGDRGHEENEPEEDGALQGLSP
jgi:hypothetical protein